MKPLAHLPASGRMGGPIFGKHHLEKMPNTPSAKRDLKKSADRRELNRGRKSSMRTWIKKTLVAVEAGDLEAAETNFVMAQKMIDKNAKWNQIQANTAAHSKSKLAKAVASLKK